MPIEISRGYIFGAVALRVQSATTSLISVGYLPADINSTRIAIEPPRDVTHGDVSVNAAMVLAKDAGKKPREIAEKYAEVLRNEELTLIAS